MMKLNIEIIQTIDVSDLYIYLPKNEPKNQWLEKIDMGQYVLSIDKLTGGGCLETPSENRIAFLDDERVKDILKNKNVKILDDESRSLYISLHMSLLEKLWNKITKRI